MADDIDVLFIHQICFH